MDNKNDILLKEELEGGLKHALFSNFSRYTDAFLELADNAVGNRIPGKILFVNILVSSKSLEIRNHGGYGMGIEELKDFLRWGKIKERRQYDLGAYSQGGKAAMGYLGNSMVILASAFGEKIQYRLEDDNLHDYQIKTYRVIPIESDNEEGSVHIEVGKLSRNINNDELKRILINTYRPLIENKDIVIKYNGEELSTSAFPVEKKLIDIDFKVRTTKNNFNRVRGWVGYLEPRTGIKGGLRCYKLGRLISEKEFFGHPDASYKQTLNFLFGEVHLDHMPVTTNKTDFDRDSEEWSETSGLLNRILKPFIDELLGREIQEASEEEKERVRQVKDIVAELMKLRNIEVKGNIGIEGISLGQKISTINKITGSNTHVQGDRKNNPKTPPPENAKGKRRRLKEFMDWDIRPMEENLRSKIEGDKERKVLVINNIFPGFIAAKGNIIYLLETAAIQLSKPSAEERITTEEYITEFDELYSFFCNNLDKAKDTLRRRKINND